MFAGLSMCWPESFGKTNLFDDNLAGSSSIEKRCSFSFNETQKILEASIRIGGSFALLHAVNPEVNQRRSFDSGLDS